MAVVKQPFDSLPKIRAIDLLYQIPGKHTPGVDSMKFWKPIRVAKTRIKQYKNVKKLKTLTPNKKKLLYELYTYTLNSIKGRHPAMR